MARIDNNRTDNNNIRAKIDEWFASRSDELLRDLARLINVKSVLAPPEPGAPYGRGAADALSLSRELLKNLGIGTEIFEDCMAEGDVRGSDGGEPELGILVHVDTVDADPAEWRTDPFRADIRAGGEDCAGDAVYGRGATDNKGPAVASMYALACARDVTGGLKKGARILVGSAEEIGCADIARYLEKRAAPPLVFAPDANYPLVNVEKGRFVMSFGGEWKASDLLPRVVSIRGGGTANIIPGFAEAIIARPGEDLSWADAAASRLSRETGAKITFHTNPRGILVRAEGKAAHASRPCDGVNAQTALLYALTNCAELELADTDGARALRSLARIFPHGDFLGEALGIKMRDEVSGELTLSFNVLDLNETGFTANFDSRTPAAADGVDIEGTVKTALESAGFVERGSAALTDNMRAARERGYVTESSKTLCHHTPEDSPLVKTLMDIYREYTGDTASAPLAVGGTTYVHNIPGGVAFGTEFPGRDNRIHGRDEYIGVSELILSAKMFARAIAELCG
jgi:succinyl-diaminopimelate desuccinylase